MRANEFITENMNAEKVISTAKRMYDMYKDHTYTAAQRADDHAMSYESNTPQYRYWSQVAHEIHRLEKLGNQDVDEAKKRKRKKNRTPRSITTGWWGGYFGDSSEGDGGGVEESVGEDTYVYHASYLPDLAKGLRSVIARGLVPSNDGYYGPGVYFAYRPEDCYYHVDKENATMFRVKWNDLKKLYGVYPENKDGIQRDDEQIVVPGRVPADLLEVEYFEDEWWDIHDALSAETHHENF
jgi:hypothetical protein